MPYPADCPDCGGHGYQILEIEGARKARLCECSIRRDVDRKLRKIAPRDRWAQIETLRPCEVPGKCFADQQLQAQVIARLQAEPDRSYAFFGPSGVGKTTLVAALWRRAVEAQRIACYYTQMSDLVRGLRDFEFQRVEALYLSRHVIREEAESGRRPRVFIDEFDKVAATDFVRNAIHDLVDELYRLAVGTPKGVQLVIATNLDRYEFSQVWGANVLRRVEDICEIFDFFEAMQVERDAVDSPAGAAVSR